MSIKKIIVVDDATGIQGIANRILVQQLNYELVTASDGFEALSVMLTEMPDVAFIDVEMPNLDGLNLIEIMRASPVDHIRNMPVIMLSSHSGIFDRAKGEVVGANYYLTKPFSLESIKESLEAIAGDQRV